MKLTTRKEKLIFTFLISGILVLLLFFYLFLNHTYGFSIPCIFHEITGLYCPGCGITMTFFSLLELDIVQAFHYNALVVCLIPIFVIYFGGQLYGWIYDKKIKIFPNWFWYVLLIIAILFGILRNFDCFSFLQPTIIS